MKPEMWIGLLVNVVNVPIVYALVYPAGLGPWVPKRFVLVFQVK